MGRWLKLARNMAGAAVLFSLLTLTGLWYWSYPPEPGKFFEADLPLESPPGRLVRSEDYPATDLPEGASARRILYTTTLNGGVPATASALVIWKDEAGSGAPRRAVAWGNGTIGALPGCAVSLQRRPLRNIPAVSEVLDEGWVFIASDYAGLATPGPHPYLIGEGEARSILDAVRAAHDLRELTISLETVVWGHSQGGHAALWTGILARSYAPELQVKGVAAISPASDLPAMLTGIEATPAGRILSSYVARAYADTYPDLYFDGVVRPGARWQAREMARRCLADSRAIVPAFIAGRLTEDSIFSSRNTGTAFRRRLAENVPAGPIGVPILILQGTKDEIAAEPIQAAYVAGRCRAGERVDYQPLRSHDHLSIVQPDAPTTEILMTWSRGRFAGRAGASTCPE